jgi:hypothetical protein
MKNANTIHTKECKIMPQDVDAYRNTQKSNSKPQGFAKVKSDRSRANALQMTTKAELCKQLEVSVDEFEKHCHDWSLAIDEEYSPQQVVAMREQFGKTEPTPQPTATSTVIPTAREGAIALSATSHEAMKALQSQGLGNAAAYVQRKAAERNAIVDKVSEAIAYLSDPGVLEGDIMSAAAAKIQARNSPWAYPDDDADWENLFALPASSQRLLGGA